MVGLFAGNGIGGMGWLGVCPPGAEAPPLASINFWGTDGVISLFVVVFPTFSYFFPKWLNGDCCSDAPGFAGEALEGGVAARFGGDRGIPLLDLNGKVFDANRTALFTPDEDAAVDTSSCARFAILSSILARSSNLFSM